MRKYIAAVIIAAGIAAVPAATPAVAHSCNSSGTKHAIIDGSHKCLKTGQFCAKGKKSAYPRYGFKCTPASDGRYRLKKN